MTSENINIRIKGILHDHLLQQIGENGLYDNASEYIRSLIRNDLKKCNDSWSWLKEELEDGILADEDEYYSVSADDVINRNKTS